MKPEADKDFLAYMLYTLCKISDKVSDLKEFNGNPEEIDGIIDSVYRIILDNLGIPPDQTLDIPPGFCRDFTYDCLTDAGLSLVYARETVDKLIKIKKDEEKYKLEGDTE